MADLSIKEKRKGLEYANQVAELATSAPNSWAKRRMYQVVNEMQREFGLSDAEKRVLIARYLDVGCSNYEDLHRETKIPKQTLREIVPSMQSAGHVEITPLAVGTGGRPRMYIRLLVPISHFC